MAIGEPPVRDVSSSPFSLPSQSNRVGRAKQRHCFVRQHNSFLNMTTSLELVPPTGGPVRISVGDFLVPRQCPDPDGP